MNLFLCIQVCLKSTPLGGSLYLNLVASQCHVWPHFSSTLFKYGWLNCVFQTLILILLCVFSLFPPAVLPALVDRLGDGKDQVRENSQALILRCMEQTASSMVRYMQTYCTFQSVSQFIYCLKSFQRRSCVTNSSANSILYCILSEDSVSSKLFSSMVISMIWKNAWLRCGTETADET